MTEEKEICVGVPKLCGLNLLMQTHSQLVPLRGPLVKGFNLGKKKIHTVSSCLSITTKKICILCIQIQFGNNTVVL